MAIAAYTPSAQVRLTNVAYVRLQKKGKRFEIACYRNKVLNWRNKMETDIREVLQIDTVFANVSKGMIANTKDLLDVFGTTDQLLVCKEILDKGELQVTEQERSALLESTFRDVAAIVADKSINPENNRPYTVTMIQNAMRQIHFSVSITKSAKSQALEVLRKLKEIMPIARASMLLRVVCNNSDVAAMKQSLSQDFGLKIVQETVKAEKMWLDLRVDPEIFRKIEESIQSITRGTGRLDVLQFRDSAAPAMLQQATATNLLDSNTAFNSQSQSVTSSSSNGVDERDAANNVGSLKKSKNEEDVATALSSSIAKLSLPSSTATSGSKASTSMKKSQLSFSMLDGMGSDNEEEEDENEEEEEDHGVDPNDVEIEGVVPDENENENENEDEEDILDSSSHPIQPDHVFGIAKKTSKKSKKGKNKGDDASCSTPTPTATTATTTAAAAAAGPQEVPVTPHVNKKSKKMKRIEKEETKEKDKRLQAIRDRVSLDRNRNAEVIGTASSMPSSSSSSSSSSSEGNQPQLINASTTVAATTTSITTASKLLATPSADSHRCNTCGVVFSDASLFRNHFRSEWHRHNLKRKMKNLPLIMSEEEFSHLNIDEIEI